jgi:hypothetical protein
MEFEECRRFKESTFIITGSVAVGRGGTLANIVDGFYEIASGFRENFVALIGVNYYCAGVVASSPTASLSFATLLDFEIMMSGSS